MKLIYIYHSGFAIEGDGFTIIIDCYKDSSEQMGHGVVNDELLLRPGKIYVLASHSHPDHFNPQVLEWKNRRPDIQYILSKDILDHKKAGPDDAVYLDKLQTYQDDILTIKAFGSTDIGVSFLIETGEMKIFHAGDLNNWHWKDESTKKESDEAEAHYLRELNEIVQYTDHLNVAIFPVDPRLGSDYMLGAKQFVDAIRVDLFVPMHFTEKYERAASFRSYAESKGCQFFAISHKGESIDF